MTAADANEYFLWAVMAGAAFSVGLGLVRLHAWSERRHFARLDAEFRAWAMLAEARYDFVRAVELERGVCALEVEWAAEPCATTVAAEARAEQLNDATRCEEELRHV
ncbi:hypothetical protein HF319_02940 [Xanthomonas sp. Kuri4-1]